MYKKEKIATQVWFLPSLIDGVSHPPAPIWLFCTQSLPKNTIPSNSSRHYHSKSPKSPPCTHGTLGALWCSKAISPRALTLSRRLRSSNKSRRNGRAVKMILYGPSATVSSTLLSSWPETESLEKRLMEIHD